MNEKEKIHDKWYKIVFWITERVESFPNKSKFTLGDSILKLSLNTMEKLVEAFYRKDKRQELFEVNINLEKLRLLFRMAYDKKYISMQQYEYISENINETGRMVGGWVKSLK